MEDRYLFKAKFDDSDRWVKGQLVEVNDTYLIIPNHASKILAGWFSTSNVVEVKKDTICQCTGLKDKNGKLIWENDIVKRVDKRNIFREQPSMNCKVVWTYNYGFDTLPSCGYFGKSDGLECEVIGNFFDNPELLEVGE